MDSARFTWRTQEIQVQRSVWTHCILSHAVIRKWEALRWTQALYLPGIQERHHLPDAVFTNWGLRGFAEVFSLLFKPSPRLWKEKNKSILTSWCPQNSQQFHWSESEFQKMQRETNLRPVWWAMCNSQDDLWCLFCEHHRFPLTASHLWKRRTWMGVVHWCRCT